MYIDATNILVLVHLEKGGQLINNPVFQTESITLSWSGGGMSVCYNLAFVLIIYCCVSIQTVFVVHPNRFYSLSNVYWYDHLDYDGGDGGKWDLGFTPKQVAVSKTIMLQQSV